MPSMVARMTPDHGNGDGIDGGDAKSVQERIRGFVRDEMDPDGGLVRAGEEAEPVGMSRSCTALAILLKNQTTSPIVTKAEMI